MGQDPVQATPPGGIDLQLYVTHSGPGIALSSLASDTQSHFQPDSHANLDSDLKVVATAQASG